MTETNSSTETLAIVQVSEAYGTSGLAPRGGIGNGTFFAKRNDRYWLLIVPESDPRSEGMWNGGTEALSVGLDNADTYRAWNVEPQFVTVLTEESPTVESPTDSPREVSKPADLRQGDVFTVAHDTSTHYVVTGPLSENGRSLPIVWQSGPREGLEWAGPTVDVTVSLVPESDQQEWARNKSREVSPVEVSPDDVAPEQPEESVTLTSSELARRIEEARLAGKREADATFESWKESANRTAIEYANDNSLCSEFDRCMRDIGMLDREQHREEFPEEYDREYTVTVSYTTTVTARDDESAVEEAQEQIGSYALNSYGDWEAEESY